MSGTKVIGIIVLVVGVILLYFGWQSSQGIDDQVAEAVTGQFRDNTMALLIGGVVAVIAGGFLTFIRK